MIGCTLGTKRGVETCHSHRYDATRVRIVYLAISKASDLWPVLVCVCNREPSAAVLTYTVCQCVVSDAGYFCVWSLGTACIYANNLTIPIRMHEIRHQHAPA